METIIDSTFEKLIDLKRYGIRGGNKPQREFAQQLGKALEIGEGQICLEGDTGTGKTLAYLVPALLQAATNNTRVIISTFTLNLQAQIMAPGSDMEAAIEAVRLQTGVTLTAARMMGRRNFVCHERVDWWLSKLESGGNAKFPWLTSERLEEWQKFAEWAKTTKTGLLAEWIEETDGLPYGVDQGDVCLRSSSSPAARARHLAHIISGQHADVLVVNHAMLVMAAKRGISILHLTKDQRPISALILDEADRLPGVAASITANLVTIREMNARLRRWNELFEEETALPVSAAAQTLLDLMTNAAPERELGEEGIWMWSDLPSNVRTAIATEAVTIIKHSEPLNKHCVSVIKDASEDDEKQALAEEILDDLQALDEIVQAMDSTGQATTILSLRWSPERNYPAFRTFRLAPARILKRLWAQWQPAGEAEAEPEAETVERTKANLLVLTSATLSAPAKGDKPDFMEMMKEFGIWDPDNPCAALHRAFAPDRFGEASFVFPAPDGPTIYLRPNKDDNDLESEQAESEAEEESDLKRLTINPDWVEYSAKMALAAQKEGGRTLVLVTSYRSCKAIAQSIRDKSVTVIEQTHSLRTKACSELFIQQPDAIWVSPVAWEGVDLKRKAHNAIRHVVITQLPFTPPDGARNLALQRYYQNKGYSRTNINSILYAGGLSAALRKFRQGFGRGIRDFNDQMTLWVADARFPANDH